jgi:hypothetical protein
MNRGDDSLNDLDSFCSAVGVLEASLYLFRNIVIEVFASRIDAVEYFVNCITEYVASCNVIKRHGGNCNIKWNVYFTHK